MIKYAMIHKFHDHKSTCIIIVVANCFAIITQKYNEAQCIFFHMISWYSLFINCLLFNSFLMELLLIFQAMDSQESQLNFQPLRCINELLRSMYLVPPSTIPRITAWLDIFPRL